MEPTSALIHYELSENGQREAVKHGLPAERRQELGGVISSPEDVDLFKVGFDGGLSADLPLPLDLPLPNFDAALQLWRRLAAEKAEYLEKQRRATGRLPTDI